MVKIKGNINLWYHIEKNREYFHRGVKSTLVYTTDRFKIVYQICYGVGKSKTQKAPIPKK